MNAHWLRLRQVALLTDDLATAERLLTEVLDLAVCYRDPAVAAFGLVNIVMPVGSQFLEVVAPVRADAPATRQLARQGGPGGYMVITQCAVHAPYRDRVDAARVRVVHEYATPDFVHMQLHPRDTGGTFLEIDQQLGAHADTADGPWAPAGADWHASRRLNRVAALTAAEIACVAPATVAARWGALLDLPVVGSAAVPVLRLRDAELRFVPARAGCPDALVAIDLACTDRARVLDAARAHGCVSGPDRIVVCGTTINLR